MESQSRYGIMEQLNTKKIEAQKRLSAIDVELEQQQMAFDNEIHKLKTAITSEKASYKDTHANYVKNATYNLNKKKAQFKLDQTLALQAHEREIAREAKVIEDSEKTYEDTHAAFVNVQEAKIKSNETSYDKWKKIKNLNKASIQEEIKGYESALNDLKEVSKESTKK